MTDDEALARAMLAFPDEDVPRLALADWCDENHQPERALMLRRENYPRSASRVARLVAHEDLELQHLAGFAVMDLPDTRGLLTLADHLRKLGDPIRAREAAQLAAQIETPLRAVRQFGPHRAEQRFAELTGNHGTRVAFLAMWQLMPACECRPIVHVAALAALGLYRRCNNSAAILREIDPPGPDVPPMRSRGWRRIVYERSRRAIWDAAVQLLEDTARHRSQSAWEATRLAVQACAGIIPGSDRMRAAKLAWWGVGGLLVRVTGEAFPTAAYGPRANAGAGAA